MSEKLVVIFLGVFLFFAGLYFYTQHQEHAGPKSVFRRLGKDSWQEAEQIEVLFKGKGFRLVRKGGKWLIEDGFPRPAKGMAVDSFLKELSQLYGEVRAQGEKYFARFKTSQDEALHLILKKDHQVLAHLLVGKRGPRWESSFLRLKGEEKIYLVPLNLLAKFEIWEENPGVPKAEAFIDKEVFRPLAKQVKAFSFEGARLSWRLERQKEGFLFVSGKEKKKITQKEGEKILRALFPLVAEEVVSPKEFKETKGRLFYETTLGEQKEVLFGGCFPKKGTKEEYCLLKKGPFVYRVSRQALKALFSPLGKGSS